MIHDSERRKHSEAALQVAAYLAGCLVAEGCIRIDQDNPAPYEQVETAIRIIAASIDALELIGDELPSIPIDW
jgi:hypothetical protein